MSMQFLPPAILHSHLLQIRLQQDDPRIRRHLQRTERILLRQPTAHLPEAQRERRSLMLALLRRYWQAGWFPRHHKTLGEARPSIVDEAGRSCAVAYLLQADQQQELVDHVVATANYAYIDEMPFAELEHWANQVGLRKAELAQIQPEYACPSDCLEPTVRLVEIFKLSLLLLMAGQIGLVLYGYVQRVRQSWGHVLTGAVAGIFLSLTWFLLPVQMGAALIGMEIECRGAAYGICDFIHTPQLAKVLDPVTNLMFVLIGIGGLLLMSSLWQLGSSLSRLQPSISRRRKLLFLVVPLVGVLWPLVELGRQWLPANLGRRPFGYEAVAPIFLWYYLPGLVLLLVLAWGLGSVLVPKQRDEPATTEGE